MVSLRNLKSEEQARVSGGRLFHARPALQTPEGTVAKGSPTSRPHLQVTPWCQQSGDSDERRSQMSAAGCQTGTPVLCHAHNGTQEHTTGTRFAPGRATSEAPVAVESCVLTSGAPCGGIQQGLQSVLQVYRGTHRDRVTLIQPSDD